MKILIALLICLNLYSSDCVPRSDSEMIKIDIQIKSLVININQKGKLKADSLNCQTNEFNAFDFYLNNIREKHLRISQLERDWVNVLNRDILNLKKSFEFIKNMLTEKPLMKAKVENISHLETSTNYDLHVALIDGLTTSDENPIYRFINIKSVYSSQAANFKNYLILKNQKIQFDKMKVQISIVPLKMKTLLFYKNDKLIKKIKTKTLKSARL